jgi:integrase/recombinase XerD
MTLYATRMRRSEVAHLKIGDIDSQRMILRTDRGKGGKSRDLPLSPALLETLREHWRWRKPKTWLFPQIGSRGKSGYITAHTVWHTCDEAARHAGLNKRVAPHMLAALEATISLTTPCHPSRHGKRATGNSAIIVFSRSFRLAVLHGNSGGRL